MAATTTGVKPDTPVPGKPGVFVGEVWVYHFPTRELAGWVRFPFGGFYPFRVGFTPDGEKIGGGRTRDWGKVMAWDFAPIAP